MHRPRRRPSFKKLIWVLVIVTCGSGALAAQYHARTRRAPIRLIDQRDVESGRVDVRVTFSRECGDAVLGYNLVSLGTGRIVDPHVIGVEVLVRGGLPCSGPAEEDALEFRVNSEGTAGVRFERLQPDETGAPRSRLAAELD